MFNLTSYKQCWHRLIPHPYDTRGLLLYLEENLVCLSAPTFFLRNYLIMLPLSPFLAVPWKHSFLCCLSKKWLLSIPEATRSNTTSYRSSLLLLVSLKPCVPHVSADPWLHWSKCLEWGITPCLSFTLEEVVGKHTLEWGKKRPGTAEESDL